MDEEIKILIDNELEEYVYYYDYERPSYALNYKTPIHKIDVNPVW